ncbi:hypothetical protein DFO58_2176 [Arthrobacter sp. AG1021]|uniref:hypothetical protein n=1 Tax=Arthrobacter sp. AG1021 TaxID=2183908 RepID=UPI000EB45A10|nr:hypothetical protein [Arthrobacter sp. AG1021]RKS19674.1 hypothetical protein DFO58_2176 [Arthrobacter sp. AG1021]
MTSKTFKSAYPGRSNQSLEILRADNRVRVSVDHASDGARGIIIAPSDAPALALAILEAAGYKEHSKANLGSSELLASYGMTKLRQAVQAQVREESETKSQAELEAEALMLANSAVLAVGNPPYPSIEHMSDTSLRKWLAVARKARELGGSAEK